MNSSVYACKSHWVFPAGSRSSEAYEKDQIPGCLGHPWMVGNNALLFLQLYTTGRSIAFSVEECLMHSD